MPHQLRYRQVHLDFHTSEQITGIGAQFDPQEFARVLVEARVDSITCFSRCHHGMIYHETRFPARHPHLSRNLLRDQIEACHKVGIRVPIYITVGWDEYSAREHPEWCEVTPDGKLTLNGPLQAGWHKLCLNRAGYVDYVIAQTREVLQTLPVDGLFFDIVFQGQCCCSACVRGMLDEGLDPTVEAHRKAYGADVVDRFRHRMTASVRQLNQECTIFYNAGHVGPGARSRFDPYTHLELESLPSGGWGYDHFPLTVRYARLLGLDFLGMTGKFLKSWADFGGFKTEAGLEYDCFTALALGGKCSVGDQLHPSGKISTATYNLIGHVYKQVEAREPWCGGVAQTDIALLSPEAYGLGGGRVPPSAAGALRILQEGHHQFDVVDETVDLEGYKVLILPDVIPVSPALRNRLEAYLKAGGAILCSYESAVGGILIGADSAYEPDYVVPDASLGAPVTPHAMYNRAKVAIAPQGARVLATTFNPYFNREWRHFSSHFQTPNGPEEGGPAVIRAGNVIYFAHPIFQMYKEHAARSYRQMVLGALAALLPDPLVRTDAPTTARLTLNRQEAERRSVLHLLHYVPERKADKYDVVEEVLPLYNIALSVRADRPVEKVYLAPSGQEISFTVADGRIELTVPEVHGYQMVVLQEVQK